MGHAECIFQPDRGGGSFFCQLGASSTHPQRHRTGSNPTSLTMPTSYRASRAKDYRCWCLHAVMAAAAMGCLLQPSSAFLTHHVPPQSRVLRSSSATTTAMAAAAAAPQPKQSTATEDVRPASLESLVAEPNPREPVRSLNDAKKQLLERVGYGRQSPGAERPQSEEERVGYLLEVLEGNYKPILTIGFFNFAVQVSPVGCIVRFSLSGPRARASARERAGATHDDACTRAAR